MGRGLFMGEGGKVGSRKRHNGTCQEKERGRERKRKKDRDTQEGERREEKGEEDWCKFRGWELGSRTTEGPGKSPDLVGKGPLQQNSPTFQQQPLFSQALLLQRRLSKEGRLCRSHVQGA